MTRWALDLDKNSFGRLRLEFDKPGSKTSYDQSSAHSPLLTIIISALPEFPEDSLALCNELLLLPTFTIKKMAFVRWTTRPSSGLTCATSFLRDWYVSLSLFLAIANSLFYVFRPKF